MNVKTIPGLCYGRKLKLVAPVRRSTYDVVRNVILYWGDDKFELDIDRMTKFQKQALPKGGLMVTNFSAKDWEPFILEVPSFASQLI